MTPDEARKDYPLKDWTPRDQALYAQGFKDGYEAAQREQTTAKVGAIKRGTPGPVIDDESPSPIASETPQGGPGR